ncbi:DUF4174 domain-containing protein [Maribacter polysaccharolyticus]|uniref:DUF4174 domain-containing protein n=1 Tax=Maribacter polysaccharolyticus TaxID=3020831 RepID=UPI00237F43E6|nr:DUF4174 domain-containing protein [Maribacter polysaccharolyticus]MDE3743878.1 DUF4174 domain-containing protein [Maribacter polysaccharolyticus]
MKNSIIHKILFLIVGFLCANSNGQDLNAHKWKNRILIVKTLNSDSEKFYEQLNEFKNSNNGLKERKIVLYKVIQDEFSSINFTNNGSVHSGKVSEITPQNILDKNEDFEVILIGLDGGIKFKQNEVLLKEKLFRIIDSMPMRKSEIRN